MPVGDVTPRVEASGVPDRLRHLLALLVAAHGVAHLAGTSEAIGAIDVGSSVDYVVGWWTISTVGLLWFWAVVWATVAGLWLVIAVAIWTDRPGWPARTIAAAVLSLVLCVVALPAAAIGVAVDAGLIVVAIRVRRSVGSDGPAAAATTTAAATTVATVDEGDRRATL